MRRVKTVRDATTQTTSRLKQALRAVKQVTPLLTSAERTDAALKAIHVKLKELDSLIQPLLDALREDLSE